MTESHRYHLRYGTKLQRGYVVWDTTNNKVVFHSLTKSLVIAEAQRLNGFDPVDGSERTYGYQVGCARRMANANQT